jgi:transposase-like protein
MFGSEEVPTMSDVDTSGAKRRRNKRWPEALKREIVAATYLPGSSVSVVARQYDVNANQVFRCRRLAGNSGAARPPSSSATGLVPVTIAPQ